MGDIYQLAIGERVPYKLVPSKVLPGDTAVVRSSHPESATVLPDNTPLAGTIASGNVVGGQIPRSAVALQGTISHTDGTVSTSVFLVDVGGGDPPAPKPPAPPEPVRAHLTLGPSAASKVKPAPRAQEKA